MSQRKVILSPMLILLGLALLALGAGHAGAAPGDISTVAGNGTQGSGGDGGQATSAQLSAPHGVAVDVANNVLYIGDPGNNRVRKVDLNTGIITTVAGTGLAGYSGDGGPAIAANVRQPYGVALDGAGNLYIADSFNNRVRKVHLGTGIITLVAGDGTPNTAGDGGQATSAQINHPHDVAIYGQNLYIAEQYGNRIRKVDLSSGIITTVAGTGTSGFSDGPLPGQLSGPFAVEVDGAGNLYIADWGNHRLRKVDVAANTISTIAGDGTAGVNDGALPGRLHAPRGVVLDGAGNIYIGDSDNNRVRKVDVAANTISTIAGTGTAGSSGDGGPATSAQLGYPTGVAFDGQGNLYIGDHSNHKIRRVEAAGIVGYTITASAGANGSIAPPGVTAVSPGANQSYTITPDAGYHIADVLVDGASVGSVGSYTFTNVQAGHTIDASFAINTYTITATAGANGSIAPPGGTVVNQGDDQAYTITPDAGYHIADVLVDGGSVGAVSTYTFTNVQADHTIDASFASNSITVGVPTITATYNEVLTIPVSIGDATGLIAAEVFVEYDTALLTVFSAPQSPTSSTGTLTQGWSVQTNTEPGAGTLQTLKIALATGENAVTGPQTLINLKFTVNDVRTPASSPLNLTHVLLNNGDPANTPVDGSVTLVGNDGTIDSSPEQIVPRQDITVTVVDVDADLDGSGSTDQVSVTATNGLQTETLTLDETATPGEFVGTIGSVFSLASTAAASSSDALLQAKAGDQILFAFTDELDGNGAGPVQRTDQTNVVGGVDGTVAISNASQPGDDVHIKVVDADISNPPLGYLAASTTLDVEVVNSNSLQTETVTLTETGPSSGIFVGTLATTPGVEAGQMTSAEEDVLTVTYVDDLAADGAPQVDRTDDDQVLDPWGDADDNESLQAFDAALTLLEVLFPSTLNGLEELAANVDLDPVGTGITPYDASLILQKRVGLIASFPVQDAASTNHPQPNPGSPKLTPQSLALSLRVGDGYLSVWTEAREGIVSGDLLLAGVDGRVAMGDELGDFLLASRPTEEGLRIVFAGSESVSGPGELLRVYGGDPTQVRLARAAFNNGDLEGTGAALTASGNLPLRTALHGNWPNPFNPETSIRFELAQASQVRLEVFDALGQKVKTLVAQSLPAGSHQVRWRGDSESGQSVSSGVYFYRLQTGDYSQMRRMLLLK